MDNKRIKPLKTPIYRDSGFKLESVETTKKAFEKEKLHQREPDLYIYSRYRNPTIVAVEEQMMKLEGAEWALFTQSGMAAIDTALSIFHRGEKTGTWLFFSEIYGGTNTFIDEVLIKRRGVRAERFYPEDGIYNLEELSKMMTEHKPEVLYLEAVSNPMLIVTEMEAIIAMAKIHGSTVIIDNTFTTPYLWKPLDSGADLVIHSATKYLSGHGDITAGVICGNDPTLGEQCLEYRKYVGHMLSPDDAYRLGNALHTFNIRMEKHCENAHRLSEMLLEHPMIEEVHYPGLPTHPTYKNAIKLFSDKGYGGMITIALGGSSEDLKAKAVDQFVAQLAEEIPLVPSLGDAASTLLPIAAVWGDKYPDSGLIRLSIGIEPYDRLSTSIQTALDNIKV
jgi:cystathionine beta-lyase/cystathionine gamma-synthase